jgi:hypothetical protein
LKTCGITSLFTNSHRTYRTEQKDCFSHATATRNRRLAVINCNNCPAYNMGNFFSTSGWSRDARGKKRETNLAAAVALAPEHQQAAYAVAGGWCRCWACDRQCLLLEL